MKMWNISVAPMPSMISMPVDAFQSARVAAGSASPAATHLRRDAHAARHHVAMEMHRRLRLAGGAGGEGEEAGVGAGGVDVGEGRVVARHQRFERGLGLAVALPSAAARVSVASEAHDLRE